MKHVSRALLTAAVSLVSWQGSMAADSAPTTTRPPLIHPDGSIEVAAFTMPASSFASPESIRSMLQRQELSTRTFPVIEDIPKLRKVIDVAFTEYANKQSARYKVDIQSQTIGGIKTEVFTPKPARPPRIKTGC